MLSQTKYKIIYSVYCFGISFLLFGILYLNFTRLRSSKLVLYGLGRVEKRNLVEIGIISAVIIVVCLFRIIDKGLWLSPWKFIYAIIPTAIIFMIEFLLIFFFDQLPFGRITILKLLSILCSLCSCVISVGLILCGILLNRHSNVNVLLDEDGEVVSAIFLSIIAVMLVTILSYILLCI